MDPINPSVIALHGALVELTLRMRRVEAQLALREPVGEFEPCSCEESIALRQHIAALAAKLGVLR